MKEDLVPEKREPGADAAAGAGAAGGIDRREFLRLAGASLALAGAAGCAVQPTEQIVPYVEQPEGLVPGQPLFYATAMPLGGYALGVLARSDEGRPTKIEGNPLHPASLGATDRFAQAAILSLYDPDRSKTVLHDGRDSSWPAFSQAMAPEIESLGRRRGEGLRLLTETVTSPALAAQIRRILEKFPAARWHQYEPLAADAARAGARLAFGKPMAVRYAFDRADVVLALESDFLCDGPGAVRYARDFAARRRVTAGADMNRLYAAESAPSVTGAKADHRRRLRSGQIEGLARAVARELGVKVEAAPGWPPSPATGRWAAAVARDLAAHRGASIVIAGDSQPAAVHALAHFANGALGNAGSTVIYGDPVEAEPVDQMASIASLAGDLAAGKVDTIVILGANPAFTAPADLDFAASLVKVRLSIHLGGHYDETGWRCRWHIPEAHWLESWGDARAFDGTVTLLQPLIAPLHGGKSAHEVLGVLEGGIGNRNAYDIVKEHWRGARPGGGFEAFWRKSLHDGVVEGTVRPPATPALVDAALGGLAPAPPPDADRPLELTFRPDPGVWDGRFANNAWLQEFPRPFSQVTWDAVASISPATARRLGLASRDLAELRLGDRKIEFPLWVQPGQADDSVAVRLGYGRPRAGRVGGGQGFDAYPLRTSRAPWCAGGLEVRRTGKSYPIAVRQEADSQHDRPLVRKATLAEYRNDPGFVHRVEEEKKSDLLLYPPWTRGEYSWGMVIDLSTCTGCGACVLACQAENNVPVVGKDQVSRGRIMHWLRVDRYFEGDTDSPDILQQVVFCMHCEYAPCEYVCPVHATVHSDAGLNEMVYNRCVGTRYCSNNCPYKVRRFNFYEFNWNRPAEWTLARNPQVTVRSRGVMEKCTYCIQRIMAARIRAHREGRRIRDGEVLTACQQACPSGCLTFGDVGDPTTRAAALVAKPLDYAMLSELNTRPRTTYLGLVRNPNPEMERA